jgi:diacylglycerol O-acyltransferase
LRTTHGETLSPADLAWLRVQTPENLPVTTIALVCSKPIEESCLKSRIEDRLLAEPRFRQRVEPRHVSWVRPRWLEHDDFLLDDHFIRPGPGAEPTLDSLLSQLRSRPLDPGLPLWQLHLIRLADGRSAIVLRIHATMADSRAALDLALRLTDDQPPAAHTPPEVGFEPAIPPHAILDRTEKQASRTRALCRLISSRSDRDNPLRRHPTGTKRLAWSAAVELRHLEKRAADLETSMTHVLMAGVVAGLRTAIHSKDIPTEDVKLRAVVPLSLRQDDATPIGTRLALGLLPMPLDGHTPTERLAQVSEAITRLGLTAGQMPVLGPDAAQGLSMTEFEERSLRLLGKKATVMLAIASGPHEATTLCKQPLAELLWWPGELGEISLSISIVTYAQNTRFMISCDNSLDLDPQVMADNMTDAIRTI